MLISFVIPTRNRSNDLNYTLNELQKLDPADLGGGSELVIVDNGSDVPATLPGALANGIRIQQVHLRENMGAGARNIGVERARGDWIIMLDDDSNLHPGPVGAYLSGLDTTVAAVGGEIFLPSGQHESGGLPEVFVGCGCAIRRDAFLDVGGYDASFGYYAEEYDLCAKLIGAGYSIGHTRAICFEHRKCALGRDMNEIIYRLVRNNGWVLARYAPDQYRQTMIEHMISRYEQIADKEQAGEGFVRGVGELEKTIVEQRRTPLSDEHWARFVGQSAIKSGLVVALEQRSPSRIRIVGPKLGKGLLQIRSAVEICGHTIIDGEPMGDEIEVVGTLSPGPMLDAKALNGDAICPWIIAEATDSRLCI